MHSGTAEPTGAAPAQLIARFVNGWSLAITVVEGGQPIHETHPGRDLHTGQLTVPQATPPEEPPEAELEEVSGLNVEQMTQLSQRKWQRNKYSIYADMVLGALFFIVGKVTEDLALAALIGAGAGLVASSGAAVCQSRSAGRLCGLWYHHAVDFGGFFVGIAGRLLGANERHCAGVADSDYFHDRWATASRRLFWRSHRALYAFATRPWSHCRWHEPHRSGHGIGQLLRGESVHRGFLVNVDDLFGLAFEHGALLCRHFLGT